MENASDGEVYRWCKGRRGRKRWRDRADEVLALRAAELNGERYQRLARARLLGR
jgi:hypothetical protein